MLVLLSHNVYRLLVKTHHTIYQNIRGRGTLRATVLHFSVSVDVSDGYIFYPQTRNTNAGKSILSPHVYNSMPKRKLLQDSLTCPKRRKVDVEVSTRGANYKQVPLNGCFGANTMGGSLSKCPCWRSETGDSAGGECTEHTTLLSPQAGANRTASQVKHLPAQQTVQRGASSDAENVVSTSEQAGKKDSESVTQQENAKSNDFDEGDVNVHEEDGHCQNLIEICDKSESSNTAQSQQLVDDSTQPEAQNDSVSSQSAEKWSKPTVLPQHLLDNITSLVSEKCETEETWVHDAVHAESEEHEVSGHTSSEEKDDKVKGKKEKVQKPRPNYFVAVQITNPEIHCGLSDVQLAVLLTNSRMKEVMIKLTTLHLTVMVMRLESEEEVEKAGQALEECGRELRERFKTGLPVIEVAGIGTFRNQVVFAKVSPGDALDELFDMHDCVVEKMASHGILSTEESSLTPHITIMKMSKVKGNFRRTVAKKIDPSLYSKFKDMTFGNETVQSLQLCSMEKPKDKLGYYQVTHQVYLGQGEVTVSQFGQSLARSVVVSALEKVKDERCKKETKDAKPKKQREKKEKPLKKQKTNSKETMESKKE